MATATYGASQGHTLARTKARLTTESTSAHKPSDDVYAPYMEVRLICGSILGALRSCMHSDDTASADGSPPTHSAFRIPVRGGVSLPPSQPHPVRDKSV